MIPMKVRDGDGPLQDAAGFRRQTIGALAANQKAESLYRAFGFDPYVTILVKAL